MRSPQHFTESQCVKCSNSSTQVPCSGHCFTTVDQWRIQAVRWVRSTPLPPPLPSLCKTTNCNSQLTNTVLLSSRWTTLHHCPIIFRISPASGGLVSQTSYRGFAPGPRWGTFILRLSDNPPSQILDTPLRPSGLELDMGRSYKDHSGVQPSGWTPI